MPHSIEMQAHFDAELCKVMLGAVFWLWLPISKQVLLARTLQRQVSVFPAIDAVSSSRRFKRSKALSKQVAGRRQRSRLVVREFRVAGLAGWRVLR